MQQGGWVRYYDAGSSFGYEYADERVSSEFYPLEATVKASDNSVRSFMIHAKYAAGYGATASSARSRARVRYPHDLAQ